MAYKVVANNQGGLHVSDTETLVHAECNGYEKDDGTFVTPDDEAREWFAALDKSKADAYAAANAAPVAEAANTSVPSPLSNVARSN